MSYSFETSLPARKENLIAEIWKDIPGYEGYYMANSFGAIKSLIRYIPYRTGKTIKLRSKILKLHLTNEGYLRVSLSISNNSKSFLVHRLIASAFLLNHENKPQVNHKNGIRTDNNITNLEWCTCLENSKHAYAFLPRKPNNKLGADNIRSKPVLQFSFYGNLIKRWNGIKEITRERNFSAGNIWCCVHGRSKSAYGFKWQYEKR